MPNAAEHDRLRWFAILLASVFTAPAMANSAAADDSAALEFFETRVRPLLIGNCYTCHSADTNSRGGLRVDDRDGLITGGGRGPAIVPGKPDESLLLKAVRHADKLKMPPEKQLAEEDVAILTKWIADGAAWPRPRLPATIGKSEAEYEEFRKEHWAWQPLGTADVPQPGNAAWGRDDIDRFLLARLEQQGLQPVADADRHTLIRRVTFDLTGLPPAPEDVETFVTDASAKAFEKLVDRLLASPAFGERWGRHWLDVARYGESTGSARNVPYPHAWRYRDYVVAAFNADKPYNQFLREQIAGDLLPANSPAEKAEQLIATGFLALGVKDVNQRFKVRYIMDNIDEQIDTVSRSVLALTVSCARCHDHKFDPIPTADYYALAGIFHSTDLCAGLRNKMGGGGLDYYDTEMLLHLGLEQPDADASANAIKEAEKALAAARAEFQAVRENPEGDVKEPDGRPKRAVAKQKVDRLQAELAALRDPATHGPIALGVRDAKNPADTEIRIRGEAEKRGPGVPRGFLSLLQFEGQPQVNPEQSGRLELARWLTSEKNPLTSRVIVNRVWQHLFGAGLVTTVDNFGVNGDRPSHPELLDYLAARFVREGWSIKKLVRVLVMTHAYQLGSDSSDANVAVDPANRLIWRHAPRRLEAEEIRDAMLAASGQLNLTPPEASPAKSLAVVELRNNGPEARRFDAHARASLHRSVYLPLLRGLTPTSLEVFDFAEQGMVTGSRDTTTVAPQALYLLNDPFVRRQSLALAERLRQAESDDAARIRAAYQRTLGRTATSLELERALRYLSNYEAALREEIAAANPPATVTAAAGAAQAETATDAEAADPAKTEATKAELQAGGADPKGKPARPKKPEPALPVNPDDPVAAAAPVEDQPILPNDPQAAAWTSFCQALFSAAEFRYLK